jgi:hypothetical protein
MCVCMCECECLHSVSLVTQIVRNLINCKYVCACVFECMCFQTVTVVRNSTSCKVAGITCVSGHVHDNASQVHSACAGLMSFKYLEICLIGVIFRSVHASMYGMLACMYVNVCV